MCSTCGGNATSAISTSINLNYANNNAARNYQPSFSGSAYVSPSRQILTPSQAYYKQIVGAPCLQIKSAVNPLNAAAAAFVNQPMVNIDGQIIASANNTCLFSCNNTGNNMIVPTHGKPVNNYVLPGAVPSAVRFFKQCGV
jgi:hypothetical protein